MSANAYSFNKPLAEMPGAFLLCKVGEPWPKKQGKLTVAGAKECAG